MISIEDVDDVAVVRLEHGKVNALDLELCQAISAAFRATRARAVVLTGSGTAFCAGVDLWRVLDGGKDYVGPYLGALVDAFAAVFTCERPVVAAINGHAIAGGCVLASACDHRVMTSGGGGVGIPEMPVGVPFPTTALTILEHALGGRTMRKLAYGGDVLDADAALAAGLVDELAPPDQVLDRALARASRLASSIPPATFAATKRHLNRLPERSAYDDEVVRLWQERVADGWIAAYMARTVRRPSI